MFRRYLPLAAMVLSLFSGTAALAAADVTNVVVGDWKTGKNSVNSITIQGDDIYLDGVLQKQKYKPGMDVVVRNGTVAVVPADPERDARKAADKAAAKQARDAQKEALKAQLKGEKEAIKREAAAGMEKGAIKTNIGTVVNKGGTVRIGDKVYQDTTPGTEADIPPETRKLIEDAQKLGQ